MANSKTAIANGALLLINEKEIQTFNPAKSKVEKVISRFFDTTYEEVCSEFAWNFCTDAMDLPLLLDEPIGWSSAFSIPSAPKTLKIFNIERVGDNQPNWERRGNKILINAGSCAIKYSYKVANIDLIPAHVVRCIETLLASKIAVPILGMEGQNLAAYYQNMYITETRPNAQMLDANEGQAAKVEKSNVMGGTMVDGQFYNNSTNFGFNVNATEDDNPAWS